VNHDAVLVLGRRRQRPQGPLLFLPGRFPLLPLPGRRLAFPLRLQLLLAARVLGGTLLLLFLPPLILGEGPAGLLDDLAELAEQRAGICRPGRRQAARAGKRDQTAQHARAARRSDIHDVTLPAGKSQARAATVPLVSGYRHGRTITSLKWGIRGHEDEPRSQILLPRFV